jgi:hypothetical protein
MLSQPKWVKKANQYVVTEREDDFKNHKQIQHWFYTEEEAYEFIKNLILSEK